MYLWGVHLSKDARITVYEPAFLAHALRSTAGSLSGTHPRTILHSMQASVLLAYYFIRNARFLEGKYHTSAAVSIAVSAGLHRIRARQEDGPIETPSFSNALPPAKCAAEEGERISAFWSVLNLNNCWAGTDGSPSNVSYGEPGLKIDTPWPLDTSDYVEVSSPHSHCVDTILNPILAPASPPSAPEKQRNRHQIPFRCSRRRDVRRRAVCQSKHPVRRGHQDRYSLSCKYVERGVKRSKSLTDIPFRWQPFK
jgi:hypothetical protein